MIWPFKRRGRPDTAATLVAAMLDADTDCTLWRPADGALGWLSSDKLNATVGRHFHWSDMSLRIGASPVPLGPGDSGVLAGAYQAWKERHRAIERKRLTALTAATIADAIRNGDVR